ncbi:MAG: ABC transporter ATP-binding protein [Desulfatiglans sp.]|jgi:branched-chain amino acid transport system ATP-binding protein|nr:ABC transporter ATP-binding protein [Desulfatiglans sp.]
MAMSNKDGDILSLKGVSASYKMHTVENDRDTYIELGVLHDVNLMMKKGEIVAILGSNGAGKSTLMAAIVGALEQQPIDGRLKGEVFFDGQRLDKLSPQKIVKLGITLVPESRFLFSWLTVKDNLELGAFPIRKKVSKAERKKSLENIFRIFPRLKERQHYLCDRLSGGEGQMVAVGRGLQSRPKLLLLDEPCLGLAPLIVKELMHTLALLRSEHGITILIAEQNISAALSIADRGYVLMNGKVVAEGSAQELLVSDSVKEAYLG